jgi:methionyl-tRNA formyltransferase
LIEAEDKVDSGVIYAQEWIDFEGHELLDELHNKQALATINLCKMFVDAHPFITDRQNTQTGVESFYPRRRPADSLLDVNDSLTNQFNLLRVVDNYSYPAFFEYSGYRYEIHIKKQSSVKGLSNG